MPAAKVRADMANRILNKVPMLGGRAVAGVNASRNAEGAPMFSYLCRRVPRDTRWDLSMSFLSLVFFACTSLLCCLKPGGVNQETYAGIAHFFLFTKYGFYYY